MDIKKRIQELSLDDKAKLYFMGLVRKGVIDTLPEDPKAAYIRDMMDKEDPKMDPAIRSDFDEPMFENTKLKEIATELGYLEEMKVTDKDGNDVTSDIIKKLEKSLEDSGYKITKGYSSDADIRPGYKTRPVKEVDGMEGGIDLNAVSYEKVTFVYTEQGGRFYGLDVYENKDQDQRSAKLKYDEANEWLKDTLAYIHEGDLIPRRYNSGLEDLDLIVARLEELGIEASHGDYMDVS